MVIVSRYPEDATSKGCASVSICRYQSELTRFLRSVGLVGKKDMLMAGSGDAGTIVQVSTNVFILGGDLVDRYVGKVMNDKVFWFVDGLSLIHI